MTQGEVQVQTSKHDTPPQPAAGGRESLASGESGSKVVDSRMLLGARREVQIRHNGAVYTLRETRQGKLILNK